MNSEPCASGRLIALEGISGAGLMAAAKKLREHGQRLAVGVSKWDGSSIFYEMGRGDPSLAKPSPRTLVLLYASDLVFRLRWEIQPALQQGQCVIAVPYVETAVAFGRAAGLPRRWLVELFNFAPRPQLCYWVEEPGQGSSARAEGFLEYCRAVLNPPDPAGLDSTIQGYLEALERRRGCQRFTPQLLTAAEAASRR